MKIHGWFKLGTFTFQAPEIGSETAIHPYLGSPTGETGPLLDLRTLLPSRGYPESLQYLHLWCVSTFPAKDDVWFPMVRVQRLKRATFMAVPVGVFTKIWWETSGETKTWHGDWPSNIPGSLKTSTFYCLAINWMVNQTFAYGKWTEITISIHFFKWLFKVPGRDHIKWNMSVGLGGVP